MTALYVILCKSQNISCVTYRKDVTMKGQPPPKISGQLWFASITYKRVHFHWSIKSVKWKTGEERSLPQFHGRVLLRLHQDLSALRWSQWLAAESDTSGPTPSSSPSLGRWIKCVYTFLQDVLEPSPLQSSSMKLYACAGCRNTWNCTLEGKKVPNLKGKLSSCLKGD